MGISTEPQFFLISTLNHRESGQLNCPPMLREEIDNFIKKIPLDRALMISMVSS
jgi:hypothetical protein